MSILKKNECRRSLRYNFTEAERLDLGKKLAESLNKKASTESDLDRIKSDFKARLSTCDTEIDGIKEKVFSGYELRDYVCFWQYDTPAPGRKTLRRKEPPHEIVVEEEMTEADRQTVIEEIDAQAADQNKSASALLKQASDMGSIAELLDGVLVFNPPLPEDLAKAVDENREAITKLVADSAANTEEFPTLPAQAKKKPTKRNRFGNSGTVSVPSDEGSRDDAGADSKNNL